MRGGEGNLHAQASRTKSPFSLDGGIVRPYFVGHFVAKIKTHEVRSASAFFFSNFPLKLQDIMAAGKPGRGTPTCVTCASDGQPGLVRPGSRATESIPVASRSLVLSAVALARSSSTGIACAQHGDTAGGASHKPLICMITTPVAGGLYLLCSGCREQRAAREPERGCADFVLRIAAV